MENSVVLWQDPIEEAVSDLISKGFEDVTEQVDRYSGGEEAYVFRGPESVLYHCFVRSRVMDVLAEREIVAGMLSCGSTDTHFFCGADRMYHCIVRSRGKERVW